MDKKDSNKFPEKAPYSEFQIIFDKLDEVKSKHQDLFVLGEQNESLAGSIENIKKIVESYSAPVVQTTFTRS